MWIHLFLILTKIKKNKKLKSDYSIYCNSNCGPYTIDFGMNLNSSIKSLNHFGTNIHEYYDKGLEILPINNQSKVYDLIETKVYTIIIE